MRRPFYYWLWILSGVWRSRGPEGGGARPYSSPASGFRAGCSNGSRVVRIESDLYAVLAGRRWDFALMDSECLCRPSLSIRDRRGFGNVNMVFNFALLGPAQFGAGIADLEEAFIDNGGLASGCLWRFCAGFHP